MQVQIQVADSVTETANTETESALKVKRAFEEAGIKGFRPWRDLLLIRTNPMPVRTGSIFLPVKMTTFYGELPNLQPVTAIVLSSGPDATLKPGDQIAFLRTNFIRWDYFEDRTVLGFIEEKHVFGHADLDPGETFADLRVEFTRHNRPSL
jgi:hypothetical protein